MENLINIKTSKINKYLQDELQDILSEIDLSDTKPINKQSKEKLGRYILKCKEQGIYSPYVLFKCNRILSKTNIYKKEMLEIKLLLAYDNQYRQYDEINQNAFVDIIESGYSNCMNDISQMHKISNIYLLLPIILSEIQRRICI